MQTKTRRQREVLDFIARYIEQKGHAPSYQTIARYLGIASKTAIGKHIKALEAQGLLHRHRVNGTFRLFVGPPRAVAAAENAIEWLRPPNGDGENEIDDEPFGVPDFVLGNRDPENIAAFRMPDNGMAERNICEGDIILFERRSHARDGDPMVVTVNGTETMLRHFYRAGANIELRPTDEDFPVLKLSGDEIEIHGIYRGLLRPAG